MPTRVTLTVVICRGNRSNFYSTARVNGCLGYLLDNKCYASCTGSFVDTNSITFFVLQSPIVADV